MRPGRRPSSPWPPPIARVTGPLSSWPLRRWPKPAAWHGRAGDALRHARALRQLAGPEHPAQLAGEVLALQQADRLDDAGLLLAAAGPAARAWPELAGAQLWQELALGQLAQAEVSAATLAELGRELDRPADQELAQAARLVIAAAARGTQCWSRPC